MTVTSIWSWALLRSALGAPLVASTIAVATPAAIGLTEQTAPGRVFIDQKVHVARGFIGQQIHIQAVQLGFVNDRRQAVVVAGNQQMFTGMVFSQAGDVG